VTNKTINIKQAFMNISKLDDSMLELNHNDQTKWNEHLLRNFALKVVVLMEESL